MLEQSSICNVEQSQQPRSHIAIEKPFISSHGVLIYNWIVWAVLAQAVVLFGVCSNVINIICFVKQGFKDSVNVSLTGLAISDLGCLLPLIWSNILYTPAFSNLGLPFDTMDIQYVTSGITHVIFARISCWITATITLERCLCVAIPLKIKDISTPKRMCFVNLSIFAALLISAAPHYFFCNLGWKYYKESNRTLVGMICSEDLSTFHKYSYPINFFIIPSIGFTIIIVCTVLLVTELSKKSKWRQKSTTSEEAARMTNSNRKVAKMVVMISTLFICCFLPICVASIAVVAVPGFSVDGQYRDLVTVVGGLGFLFESINSSANILFYFHMSSKYRNIFRESVFRRHKQV